MLTLLRRLTRWVAITSCALCGTAFTPPFPAACPRCHHVRKQG